MSLLDDFGKQVKLIRPIQIFDHVFEKHPTYAFIDFYREIGYRYSFKDVLDIFLKYFHDPKLRNEMKDKYKEVLDAIIFNGVVNNNNLNKVVKNTKSMVFLKNDKVSIKPNDLLALTKNDCHQYAESFNEIINKYGTKITKVVEGSFNIGRNKKPHITVKDKYKVLAPGDDFAKTVKNICKEKVVPSLFNESVNGLSWNFPKNYIGSILQTIPIYFDIPAKYVDNDDGNYLGVYIRKSDKEKEIVLFPDVIKSCVNNDDELLKLLVWKIIIHEYAHALMDAGSKCDNWIRNNKKYCKEKEESHANAFAIRVLKDRITPSQWKFILGFIKKQPDEYKKGIIVEKKVPNIGFDMIKWRIEKVENSK